MKMNIPDKKNLQRSSIFEHIEQKYIIIIIIHAFIAPISISEDKNQTLSNLRCDIVIFYIFGNNAFMSILKYDCKGLKIMKNYLVL